MHYESWPTLVAFSSLWRHRMGPWFGTAAWSDRRRRRIRCRRQPTHKIRLASRSAIAVPPAAPRIFFDVTLHSVASGPRARLPGHSGPSDSFTLLYVRRACATPHPERPCARRDDQARAILARSTRSGSAIGTTDKSNPNYWNFPDNVVTYGGSSDLWGETWTAADINDPNFGFALAVFVGDSVALVDAMSITVFYNTLCGNDGRREQGGFAWSGGDIEHTTSARYLGSDQQSRHEEAGPATDVLLVRRGVDWSPACGVESRPKGLVHHRRPGFIAMAFSSAARVRRSVQALHDRQTPARSREQYGVVPDQGGAEARFSLASLCRWREKEPRGGRGHEP